MADDADRDDLGSGDDRDRKANILRASVDPDPKTAEYDLLQLIADSEGTEIDELPSLYDRVDHFVELLFETPPSREAQMEISFSYAGYRVTMNQNGDVTLVNVKRSMGGE